MRQQKIIEKFWKTIYQRPQRELAYDAKVPLNKEKIGHTVIMLITSLDRKVWGQGNKNNEKHLKEKKQLQKLLIRPDFQMLVGKTIRNIKCLRLQRVVKTNQDLIREQLRSSDGV